MTMNYINHKVLRFAVLLALICFNLQAFADVVIPMHNRGGVYYLPCKVNGHSEEFVFDTGASNVCLSKEFVSKLISLEAMSPSDKVGSGSSQVADGRYIKHDIYNIKTLTIGTRTLSNVRAVVLDEQNVPLLLGQTAIRRLGKIQVDDKYLIIKEAKARKPSGDTSNTIDQALDYYYKGVYRKAAELLIPEWHNGSLSNAQKLILVDAINNATYIRGIENREEALDIVHDIVLDEEIINTFGEDKFYLITGSAYFVINPVACQESYKKAFYSTSDYQTKALSLYELSGTIKSNYRDIKENAEKEYDILWDSLYWLALAFESETGTHLSDEEFMTACLTPTYQIFTYMSDDLRGLAEKITYSVILKGALAEYYDYEEYQELQNNLIESGNKYALEIKRGY